MCASSGVTKWGKRLAQRPPCLPENQKSWGRKPQSAVQVFSLPKVCVCVRVVCAVCCERLNGRCVFTKSEELGQETPKRGPSIFIAKSVWAVCAVKGSTAAVSS